ncbi:heme exporter protein CcmD [Sphingomonas sp.]
MSAIVNAWPFVAAAYAVTAAGTAGLIVSSVLAMRRAEARANALASRRDD